MNNSPGWASPGSSPSEEPGRGTQEQPPQDSQSGSGEQSPPPNWSKEQPPAGQWSAPTGIPSQGGPHGSSGQGRAGDRARASSTGPGWAGQPGHWGGPPGSQPPWGGAWAPGPQAAKPGVIPLRPLAVGEILDGAVATMRAHWRTVLGISLIVAIVAQTAITAVTGIWFQGSGRAPSPASENVPPLREALQEMGNSLAASGITSAIGLLATLVVTGLLTMVVSRAVLGRSVTAGEAWRDARTQLPRLLGLLVLLPLLIMAIVAVGVAPGLILAATRTGTLEADLLLTLLGGLAACVVSLWLGVRYSLASPALMLEKQGVIPAMRRSAKLVRGSWWRVLGVQLLAFLLVGIVEFIIQIPATIIAFLIGGESLMTWANGTSNTTGWSFLIVLGIGAVISSTITFPITAGVTALLYVDQRIRREALDLELARAAGLPGYGTDTPSTPPATPAAHAPTAGAPAPADVSADRAETDHSTPDGPGTDGPSNGPSQESTDANAPEAGTTATSSAAPTDATATGTTPADGPGQRPDDAAPGS